MYTLKPSNLIYTFIKTSMSWQVGEVVREEKNLNQQQQQKKSKIISKEVFISLLPMVKQAAVTNAMHKGRSLGKVPGTERMRERNPIHTCPWPHGVQNKWGKGGGVKKMMCAFHSLGFPQHVYVTAAKGHRGSGDIKAFSQTHSSSR